MISSATPKKKPALNPSMLSAKGNVIGWLAATVVNILGTIMPNTIMINPIATNVLPGRLVVVIWALLIN